MNDTQTKNQSNGKGNKVLVNFIQDRSGSMSTVWDETVNGFREFVRDLKKKSIEDGIQYFFRLTTFDTQVEKPVDGVPIEQVDEESLKRHGPRGSTALYDAIGLTIRATEADSNGAEKIMVIVVTDGQENSSREWTKDALQKAIEDKLKLGNWTFAYLGTQPETWDDATAIGVAVGAAAAYNPRQARATYAAMSHGVHAMARSDSLGTRSFMASYVPKDKAVGAGIQFNPKSPRKAQASPPQTPSLPRRWR